MTYPCELRIRVYVDQECVQEVLLRAHSVEEADALGASTRRAHELITDQADRDGKLWLIEIFDPDCPPHKAYTRFGTDSRMLGLPLSFQGGLPFSLN